MTITAFSPYTTVLNEVVSRMCITVSTVLPPPPPFRTRVQYVASTAFRAAAGIPPFTLSHDQVRASANGYGLVYSKQPLSLSE